MLFGFLGICEGLRFRAFSVLRNVYGSGLFRLFGTGSCEDVKTPLWVL